MCPGASSGRADASDGRDDATRVLNTLKEAPDGDLGLSITTGTRSEKTLDRATDPIRANVVECANGVRKNGVNKSNTAADACGRTSEDADVLSSEQSSDDNSSSDDDAILKMMATSVALGRSQASTKDRHNKLMKARHEFAKDSDRLDLAGLLNVLDGVVDTPGRIVVMTSNHPEKLDAALIRPGRIDKEIYLGYIGFPAAVEMTRHFFQIDQLTDEQRQRLRAAIERPPAITGRTRRSRRKAGDHGRFSPARVEQLASEYDDVNDFIVALERLAQ